MNMYESHDHTMLSVGEIAILVKMTFLTPVTLNDPRWIFTTVAFVEGN